MEHLELQIIREEESENEELEVLNSHKENKTKIRLRRKIKTPLSIITIWNLNKKRKINSETGKIYAPHEVKKKKRKLVFNLPNLPTKAWIKDYQ